MPETSPPATAKLPSAEEALATARSEIYALIQAYTAAYNGQDEGRLRILQPSFPGFDERTRVLARSVELAISDVRIVPSADLNSATVSATQTITYEWRRRGLPPASLDERLSALTPA